MPVSTKNPQYEFYAPVWERTSDAAAGSARIKGKGSKYLPIPDAEAREHTSELVRKGHSKRYEQYKERAIYTNYTGRTRDALHGAAFRVDPIIELPTSLEYLIEDATGDGMGLQQMAKDALSDLLETGRGFMLVDYPQVEENLSVEDIRKRDLKASIIVYPANMVINWKTQSFGDRKLLTLVVIEEPYLDPDDEFGHEEKKQHRVLRLTEAGYSQQIYRDDEPHTAESFPSKFDGTAWDVIPGTFVGSKNNDAKVDDPPLAAIAEVNIGHYRNSADYEESCFITGQPSLFVTHSLSAEQWKEYNPDGIKLGSRAGHVLGETGSAFLVQAEANNLVAAAMEAKEQQMVSIGARIITDRSGNETAEGARIRFSSENSVLGDLVGNLSAAIKDCIVWCGEFMGEYNECEFEINREFYDKSLDPQMIMALVTLVDRQIISEADLFERIKSSGFIDPERTIEQVQEELRERSPLAQATPGEIDAIQR